MKIYKAYCKRCDVEYKNIQIATDTELKKIICKVCGKPMEFEEDKH